MEGIQWAEADMLALPFADGSFDAVIEKARARIGPATAQSWASRCSAVRLAC